MANPKAIMVAGVSSWLKGCLAELTDLTVLSEQADKEQFFANQASGFEVMITNGGRGCSAELMDRFPDLKVILGWGVGYDKVDIQHARARGILVANTPDVLNDCVADMTLAMILVQSRRLIEAESYLRRGDWGKTQLPLGHKVSGKRLGILGLGRIGVEVANRARAFKMDIRYHNRTPRQDQPYFYEADLIKLADWADFLVVLCPGGPDTDKLVDEPVLSALGSESVLVNIARGSVVDEQALERLLLQGGLGGAALDVYAQEPKFPASLLALPQVVMFPHIGSSTVETRQAMSDCLIDNLERFKCTGALKTPVY